MLVMIGVCILVFVAIVAVVDVVRFIFFSSDEED
jgi:hypothetical protein